MKVSKRLKNIISNCGNDVKIGDLNVSIIIIKAKKDITKTIQDQVGKQKIILALSGGVDSTVVAALLNKAVPKPNPEAPATL